MSRIEIIPAILPKDFNEVLEKVDLVVGLVKTVQIDICDGRFVPSATWPYKKHDISFDNIRQERDGMPRWEELNYEFDLMVDEPYKVVDDWVSAGASRIIIHAEVSGDVMKTLEYLHGRVEVGLALAEDTSLETVDKYIDKIDFVQLMGIDRVGFQQQPFDDRVIGRVKELKVKYPELPVSVDGGVSSETAERLVMAGVDRLVIGSAIFGTDNPVEAVESFKRLS